MVPPELVTLDEVRAAARRLSGVAVRTPLVPVPALRLSSGQPLLIKPESLQPTGAFKLRGAYNAISALLADPGAGTRLGGVVTHSSGNHGFAVAYAAALLGVPAAIVVPENAPKIKTDAIERAGAELIRVEPTQAARVAAADEISAGRGYAQVPPFDDRLVIAGQGTIGLEIAEDLRNLRAEGDGGVVPPRATLLVPVSGGGLISGIAVAVKALLPGARVVGVEPELAADARDSLHSGTRVAWTAAQTARTAADALRVEQVGELTFPHLQAFVDDIVTVTEEELLGAVRRLALEARLIAEPGGAVAVAAALFRSKEELGLTSDGTAEPVVAVLSGGNIEPGLLAKILRTESYTG